MLVWRQCLDGVCETVLGYFIYIDVEGAFRHTFRQAERHIVDVVYVVFGHHLVAFDEVHVLLCHAYVGHSGHKHHR